MFFENITINTDKLINAGLLIESHFMIECIYNSKKELIDAYLQKCGSLSTPAIKQLFDGKYVEQINDNEKITFSKFKLTEKSFRYLEKDKLDHDKMFEEMKSIFPKKTPKGRRLHLDPDGCKKKYKALANSKETHDAILKCIKLEINDRTKTGNQEFMNAMPVWLNQKNYKVYLDEALELKDNISEEEGYDVI